MNKLAQECIRVLEDHRKEFHGSRSVKESPDCVVCRSLRRNFLRNATLFPEVKK